MPKNNYHITQGKHMGKDKETIAEGSMQKGKHMIFGFALWHAPHFL